MKPNPRSETIFLMVPVATMTSLTSLEQLTLTHDLFETKGSHGATTHRGEDPAYHLSGQVSRGALSANRWPGTAWARRSLADIGWVVGFGRYCGRGSGSKPSSAPTALKAEQTCV